MILACGEAIIDVFIEAGVGLRRNARFAMGGSPFNVAVALRRQGVPAGFFGGLSSDVFGTMLRAILDAEGVDHHLAPTLDVETKLALIARDDQGHPSYDFRGERSADVMINQSHVPTQLPDACRCVALSSYPLAVEPARSAMLAIARLAGPDRVVSVDVNYRAALVGHADQWAVQFAAFEPLASVMKASDEDIALAYGGRRSPQEAAAAWLKAGACLVLITRGAAGASAFSRHGRIDRPARKVDVVDGVGAGDCFHAGFLAALAERNALTPAAISGLSEAELRACLDWAILAASLNVTREGTDPPSRADMDAA